VLGNWFFASAASSAGFDFLGILHSESAQEIFADSYIDEAFSAFSLENKAALLHFNGVQSLDVPRDLLTIRLVAAFHKKDTGMLKECLEQGASAGARTDYGLPLFYANPVSGDAPALTGGEDVFVKSVKIMLRGTRYKAVHLKSGSMKHEVEPEKGAFYTDTELIDLEGYVDNAFVVSDLLQNAPNQETIVPNPGFIEYLMKRVKDYRDSNQNPVIVFVPGIIDTEYSVSELIDMALTHGANVNDVGFFGTPALVWSVILGDIGSVRHLLLRGARTDIVDEMGNAHVLAWAYTTYGAVLGSKVREGLMRAMIDLLKSTVPQEIWFHKNYIKMSLDDYARRFRFRD